MGYTTEFTGSLNVSSNITKEQFDYINKLAKTRRMKRDVKKLYEKYNGRFGKPGVNELIEIDGIQVPNVYGNEGEYFVGGEGFAGQNHDSTIIDYNVAPGQLSYREKDYWEKNVKLIDKCLCQPGLWLKWILVSDNINPNNVKLIWDGSEKFNYYIDWLKYLIHHFFNPWGITLNGEIEWLGEDPSDFGKIIVVDNIIETKKGRREYE